MKRITTRTLVLMGVLTAASIVLSRFLGFYLTETIRIGFGSVPILLAGLWLGPVAGALVGGVADILGATVFSGLGIYFPITVGPILVGLTAGLMGLLWKRSTNVWKTASATVAAEIIGSTLWTSFALSRMTGVAFPLVLAGRLPVNITLIVMDTVLVALLHRRFGAQFALPFVRESGLHAEEAQNK